MVVAFILIGLIIFYAAIKVPAISFTSFSLRHSDCSGAATTAARDTIENDGLYVSLKDTYAMDKFEHILHKYMCQKDPHYDRTKIILCIGSDRCTGDCLGPLIGSSLVNNKSGDYIVYGTLQNPVHALNLENCLKEIRQTHHNALVIAIDASLSYTKSDIGKVWLNNGTLNPGNAVHKKLPAVGDISITGIVNDFQKLHTTRLYNVTNVAEFITQGLIRTLT